MKGEVAIPLRNIAGLIRQSRNYLAFFLPLAGHYKFNIMIRSILYVIAVLLVIGWALGLFVYNLGSIIHILLVLAIISIIISFIGGSKETSV